MTSVIGPSHLHADHLGEVDRQRYYKERGIEIEAHCGLPVWSSRVPAMLREQATAGRRIVWVVTDWKANNSDYATFDAFEKGGAEGGGPTFLDRLGHAGNVSHQYTSPACIDLLARRAMRAIDEVVAELPQVRLVFWCLYKRSRACLAEVPPHASSYPRFAWYDAVVERYRANAIDMDAYTTPEAFNREMTTDAGGHPSSAGHELLSRMIASG